MIETRKRKSESESEGVFKGKKRVKTRKERNLVSKKREEFRQRIIMKLKEEL
jgi:hypothetical protein